MSITLSLGETPTLTITVTTNGVTGFDLSGATMETTLKNADDTNLVLADGVHILDPDQSANPGKFTVAITAIQSALLKVGNGQTFLVKATITSKDYFFYGDRLLNIRSGSL